MPTVSVFDKRSAVHISIAAGLVEMVRRDEKPNSYRYNKLSASLDKLLEAANDYTGNGFQGEDIEKAGEVLDDIEKLINKKFAEPKPRRVTKRQDVKVLAR
jgi:hypothetical protein